MIRPFCVSSNRITCSLAPSSQSRLVRNRKSKLPVVWLLLLQSSTLPLLPFQTIQRQQPTLLTPLCAALRLPPLI